MRTLIAYIATPIQLPKPSWSHGLTRRFGQCWKTFPDSFTVKKFPKTTVCSYCRFLDDLTPQINKSLDFPTEE